MLRIRRRQMERLDAIAYARFLRRASAEVASWDDPSLAASTEAELHDWVDLRIARGMELGLNDERALLAWLEIVLLHGEAFAESAFVLHRLVEGEALADWEHTREQLAAMAEASPEPAEESE